MYCWQIGTKRPILHVKSDQVHPIHFSDARAADATGDAAARMGPPRRFPAKLRAAWRNAATTVPAAAVAAACIGGWGQAVPIGYNCSYLACTIGHLVPIWQPLRV
jgi:hypothetical protein